MTVRPFGLSTEQIRVLGVLAEKAATTPENYPLSSNGLRTGCDQRSSRDPVVDYDDETVKAAMLALRERELELAKTVRGAGSRVFKHAHALDRLELDEAAVAVLAVLMLRGAQTVGELKTRCERQHRFASVEDVEGVLGALAIGDEPLVERLERAPGQKEARWRHLLDLEPDSGSPPPHPRAATVADPPDPAPEEPPTHPTLAEEAGARARTLQEITERLDALERNLAEIQRQLDDR